MHPNHAHRLLGVRHPLVHRQRDNKRSVPSGNRGNRGYSFRYPVLRLHSLVIHPLIPTDMAKRRSKTVEQQCRYYEVGNIFEYMVETYLNGNMSVFRGLYHELNTFLYRGIIGNPCRKSARYFPCGLCSTWLCGCIWQSDQYTARSGYDRTGSIWNRKCNSAGSCMYPCVSYEWRKFYLYCTAAGSPEAGWRERSGQ